ncbi:MAG: hypothetical protein EBR30_26515, partial [Cytophagia bacterium]|nr:hypothetical protein [Cytophagia bacterium]
YEVRNASSETLVGLPDVQYTESGQKTMVYDYIQMSSGTYTPGTIGTTQAPGDATCILRTEQTEDDGTTRQIRRVFINKGLLQQSDETKNNGALLLKTFVYLNDAPVPNPPPGYTLVSQRTENPNGLETTTYTYAKGSGQISQDDTTSNNGALLRRIIRHITAPSAVNPIATPSGYTLVEQAYQDSDGHRIWTASYAKGVGEISRDIAYSNTSSPGTTGITRTTIRYLVAPSATVQPTTEAGSVEIARSLQEGDGHRIWTTVWAKGSGEISRDIRYVQSLDKGVTNGATVITIRHLTAISVNTNPTSEPTYVMVSEDKSDQDGYRVWTVIYAKGTGTVSNTTDTREGGKLIIYKKVGLGSAPSAPAATIGGTVTLINDSSRNDSGYVVYERTWAEGSGEISRDTRYTQSLDQGVFNGATTITIRHLTSISVTANPTTAPGYVLISEDKSDQDGYRVWTVIYAKGIGLVVDDKDLKNGGKLIIYHKVGLGSAPSTPVASLGGTVVSINQNKRNDNGYEIYDYTWAEGVGIVSEKIQYRDGGLRLLNRDILTASGTGYSSAFIPFYGIEVDSSFVELDGVRRYSVTWIQTNSGGDPLAGNTTQFNSMVPFTYPGRAKAYYISFGTPTYTSHRAYDVFLSPPVQCLVEATTIVYYKATNSIPSTSFTLWNPKEWATMYARWVGWSDSPRSKVEGLRGYIKMNNGLNDSSTSATDRSVFGDRVYANTDFSIVLSGGPSDPGGTTVTLSVEQVPAFVKTDGTQYYRVTEVYATIPAQSALPV